MDTTLPSGHLLFREFVESTGLSQRAVGELLGEVSSTSVFGWMHGKFRPKDAMRQRIERWTSGAVPASSWDTVEEREAAEGVVPYTDDEAEAA